MENKEEWLEIRSKRIGGSEIAAVLNKCPYKSRRELWLEKTKQKESVDIEYMSHVQRGKIFEPVAREKIEEIMGMKFEPKMVEFPGVSYMGASLDGLSEDNTVLEIKTTGKDVFDSFDQTVNTIPEHHLLQLQYNMMCAGSEVGLYVNYRPEEDAFKRVDVMANKELWEQMSNAAHAFWRAVQTKTEPDAHLVEGGLDAMFKQWEELKAASQKAEAEFKVVDDVIKAELANKGIRDLEYGGFKAITVERVGNVQFAKIPELKGVDLEQYRGKSSKYYKLSYKEEK